MNVCVGRAHGFHKEIKKLCVKELHVSQLVQKTCVCF